MSMLFDEIALATARLAEAGVESPRADAEVIAAHVHGVKRGELHTVPDAAFDATFWADIARRANREPLQHITGVAYFRYLELDVGPGVFVPRPETEVMTGWAIDRLREMDVAEPVAVDLGTGSGAIALSIAQEVPRARVHAVEADPLARGWAEPTSPGTWTRTRRAGCCCTPGTSRGVWKTRNWPAWPGPLTLSSATRPTSR
jgi:release factor glutamine methyltransferase